ncbi:LysR family transcriptional regulator [Actinokineospora sp. NBRC 105648]|uniref:LysR family transcriptional regulator n=1 Tax=Actinokineospora sp. NBRC 105648 TaxID=3032206 RepID=UPI0024A1F86A|nr:LysR family transcriptional regulator [Actinokineospora sp. NBRC 105648]GLZ37123.1 LysR family transcriptional regulator [Actinokineospora sp. NBRC 105648]
MDVHVRDLRYFVAVAEELSFTRAANRLFIAQPTLSKQIRHLELSLRTALFERDRRSVALTAAGRALLPHAHQVIERWETARHAVAEAVAERDMVLTVGFQNRIGRGLIPAVTAKMGTLLPRWRLRFRQVSWGDPSAGLAAGEVDLAVTWLPVPDTGEFTWKVVSTEDRWVALPVGHPLAGRTTIRFADLVDEPFIAHPRSAGALRDFWLAADQRPAPARVVAEAANPDESFELVAAGVGVVLLPAENAEISARADVVYRPVPDLSPGRLAVVWRTEDRREAVQVFVDSCVRCLCHLSDNDSAAAECPA